MPRERKKYAFTLAEVMVVLLVLTILFAAFAPFITKRKRNARGAELWLWAKKNYLSKPMDAYYNPDDEGGVYFGATPDSQEEIKTSYLPLSKVIIRSGYVVGYTKDEEKIDNIVQRQLQLRYGRESFEDPGQFAGTFIADGQNMLFGGLYNDLTSKKSNYTYPENNVSFGFNSLNKIKDNNSTSRLFNNNTAFGFNSSGTLYFGSDNTTIGSDTGSENYSGSKNTLVGYGAGAHVITEGNTLVGAESSTRLGSYNTFVGAKTGNYTAGSQDYEYGYNVALGAEALSSIRSGKYNVAAGARALRNLLDGNYNVAIGYNACANITNESNVTCIGANSGPASNSPVKTTLRLKSDDDTPRTYIGANPNMKDDGTYKSDGNYGGDAVLEIHNSNGKNNYNLINGPAVNSNATTIINGNLIVRGRTYFTIGNILYPFYYNDSTIYGTNPNAPYNSSINSICAQNQETYNFSTGGYCHELEDIVNHFETSGGLTPSVSDRRLKQIFSENTEGIDKIKQLKVYNYTFKDDKEHKPHVGVIAQELQKVFPNSVFEDENGYLKIRWDEMFYAAINAIKQLNTKLAGLVKQNLNLDKKITKLEKKNADLNRQVNVLSKRIELLKNK